jgi:hypothetical protein
MLASRTAGDWDMSETDAKQQAALENVVETGVPRRPRAKYQVFISSTYDDLHEAREAVTWEILKARHIPAGMENFSAHPDRGWRVIKQTIDTSDYYVVVIAGKYGSIDPETGFSWTEREYNYAVERRLSVFAFIRDPGHCTLEKSERDPKKQKHLAAFIDKLSNAHLRERWTDERDLCSKVSSALLKQIQDDEDEGVAPPGWYRGDQVPPSSVLTEFARLSAEAKKLRDERDAREVATAHLALRAPFGKPLPDSIDDTIPVDFNVSRFGVKLAVENTGRAPAEDVVVDFHVLSATSGYFPENLAQGEGSVREDHEDSSVWFRQRIPVVAPGILEELFAMQWLPVFDESGRASCDVEYKLVCGNGPATIGTIKCRLTAVAASAGARESGPSEAAPSGPLTAYELIRAEGALSAIRSALRKARNGVTTLSKDSSGLTPRIFEHVLNELRKAGYEVRESGTTLTVRLPPAAPGV